MPQLRYRQPKHKTRKRGGPKDIPLDLQPRDNPENYPTLLRYLEANGQLRNTNYIHMMRARNLFLKGTSTALIAKELHIEPAIIDRWSLCFGWEEERDRRLFNQFRKVSGLRDRMSQNLGERHDRIAGSIEQCAERLLTGYQNGHVELNTRDLATIASTIKSTQEIRRTARGQNSTKKEVAIGVNLEIPQSLERLATAVTDMYTMPRLENKPMKTISVQIGTDAVGNDAEFEA